MGQTRIISRSEEAFSDRIEAGRLLARELKGTIGPDAVVLGIPRGGIIIAKEICRILNCELDIVLTRKIGAPGNPELAIGAISENGHFIIDVSLAARVGADKSYIEDEKKRQFALIQKRVDLYRKARPKVSLKDRIVCITDDGVATGATMQASLQAAREEKPKKLIAALPVGPEDSIENLSGYADEVIALRVPTFFGALSQFYGRFSQTEDDEVIAILEEENKKRKSGKESLQ